MAAWSAFLSASAWEISASRFLASVSTGFPPLILASTTFATYSNGSPFVFFKVSSSLSAVLSFCLVSSAYFSLSSMTSTFLPSASTYAAASLAVFCNFSLSGSEASFFSAFSSDFLLSFAYALPAKLSTSSSKAFCSSSSVGFFGFLRSVISCSLALISASETGLIIVSLASFYAFSAAITAAFPGSPSSSS